MERQMIKLTAEVLVSGVSVWFVCLFHCARARARVYVCVCVFVCVCDATTINV